MMEQLILVSGTRSLIDTFTVDLHIQLDRCPQLPQPHAARAWSKNKISPLRDRLMIEWVFCHVESMKKLHSIITTISNEISSKKPKGSSTRSITLIVGLSSGTGSCLSSCFIEKLYDYFDTFPPSDGFRVKRNHLHNDTPPSAVQWEQLPYQHSLNYHRHVKDSIKIKSLTTSKDWSPLPLILNDSLEVAYREYPLSTNVVIDDNNVDFVSGTFYNKKTGQKSFIRCTVQPEHLIVEVRDLVHETYKPFVKSYEAAGILPYSVHPVTGEAIFLIGKLTYDGGTWCDFGGLVSNFRFRETPSVTAARECYEETLGVIGSSDHLLKSLRNYKVNNAFKVINERTRYIGHYLRIPFDHYPSRFVSRVMEILSHDKSVEVDTMRWLPMSSVRRATVLSLTGSSSIDVYAIKETDGSLDKDSIVSLRIEFAHSLCIAEKLGVLDSIDYIAREIYKQHLHVASAGTGCHTLASDDCTRGIEPMMDHLCISPDQTGRNQLSDHPDDQAVTASPPSLLPSPQKGGKVKLFGMGTGKYIHSSYASNL